MKRYLFFLILFMLSGALGFWGCDAPPKAPVTKKDVSFAQQLLSAYQEHRSSFWVEGEGTVIRLLPDDLEGSRHQRFIIRLATGQTLLVSHNIDIAPRLEGLRAGDIVAFYGKYEWNDKGGVIHWTHHDPSGRQPGGWLNDQSQFYR